MDPGRLIRAFARARLAASEALAWTCGRRRLFRVRGDSMQPTLQPGEWVLVDLAPPMPVKPGDVVVARDPRRAGRFLVKRVGSRGPESVALISDNPLEAVDSRQLGSLPEALVFGPVVVVAGRTPGPAGRWFVRRLEPRGRASGDRRHEPRA